MHDDSADLYVEELDPRDPDLYRTDTGWERVRVRRETIRVRDGAFSSTSHAIEHPLRVTRHGPLIEIRGRLYALRWTMILLNEYLPNRWQRRVLAGFRGERSLVLRRQLDKAAAMLDPLPSLPHLRETERGSQERLAQ